MVKTGANNRRAMEAIKRQIMREAKCYRRGNVMCCEIEYPTVNGMRRGVGVAEIGFGLSDITGAVKSAASTAYNTTKDTLNSKELEAGIALASMATGNPELALAYQGVKKTFNTVDAVAHGDQAAINEVLGLKQAAARGDKHAQARLQSMQTVYSGKKANLAGQASNLLDRVRMGDIEAQKTLLRVSNLAIRGNPWAQNAISIMKAMYPMKKAGIPVHVPPIPRGVDPNTVRQQIEAAKRMAAVRAAKRKRAAGGRKKLTIQEIMRRRAASRAAASRGRR